MADQTTARVISAENLRDIVVVSWSDGLRCRFHPLWLRDNCMCSECGDRSGGHRYLEIGDIDPAIEPLSVNVDGADRVSIRWPGDGHLTRFDGNWLRSHSHGREGCSPERYPPETWGGEINGHIRLFDYPAAVADPEDRRQLFEHIARRGFAILDGVPTQHDQVETLAGLFGFVRETHYGRVFDLISTPARRILAETSHRIRPHTDEQFRDPVPGLFIMHCLRPSDCGGGASLFVDGFHAAEILRDRAAEAFDLLTRTAIPHRRFLSDGVDDVALAACWPMIELHPDGSLKGIHINERTMGPLDLAPEHLPAAYGAIRDMLDIVYDPGSCLVHRLESGQAAVLDNHRVLHAREAFRGNRHIRQCHVDRDEFFSRLRVLGRRAAA